jgi:hypothetical protein
MYSMRTIRWKYSWARTGPDCAGAEMPEDRAFGSVHAVEPRSDALAAPGKLSSEKRTPVKTYENEKGRPRLQGRPV